MALTPDDIPALIAENEAARAEMDTYIANKREQAVQALTAFYDAEQRSLGAPWDLTVRAAADTARTAYTAARTAFRDAATTATTNMNARVQAKINELAAT